MTSIKSLIDFIYQNILLFHFKTLSLCILNERLKNIPYFLQSLLTVISFLLFLSFYFMIIAAYSDSFSMLHFFFNNVRTHTYAQARISLLFL